MCEPLPEQCQHAFAVGGAGRLVLGGAVTGFGHVCGTADGAGVERETALFGAVGHVVEVHQVAAVVSRAGH